MLKRWLYTLFCCCRKGMPPDSSEVKSIHPMSTVEVKASIRLKMPKIETTKSSTNSGIQQTTLDNDEVKKVQPKLDGLVTPKTQAGSEELHVEGPVTIIHDEFEGLKRLFTQPTTSHKYQTKKIELEPGRSITPKKLCPLESPHTHGPVTIVQDNFEGVARLFTQSKIIRGVVLTGVNSQPQVSTANNTFSLQLAIKKKLDKPLIASKLAVLPEEIILHIVRQIYEGTDQQSRCAFFILRQVSRQFRRLAREKTFLSHPFSEKGCCAWCVGYKTDSPIAPSKHRNLIYRNAHCFERRIGCQDTTELANLVRKDKICEVCQLEVEKRQIRGVSLTCKFAARDDQDWVYCRTCHVEHPSSCFSREELQKESKRRCIATTGYVRLCEHKVLFWHDIKHRARGLTEAHICSHPSHLENDLCHYEVPRANISGSFGGRLGLSLSLTVVSAEKCRTLVPGQNSSIALDQVLEAIQSVRRQGAQCIVPERSTKTPLELDAFFPADNPGSEERTWTPISKQPKDGELKDRAHGLSVFCEPRRCGPDKSISRLCFRYERRICVRDSDWNGPSHDWYHAISPESYTYSGPPGVPGACTNPSCRNHYPFTTNSERHRVSLRRNDRVPVQSKWH